MKILHIIDSGGLYGAEIMLQNLCAEQKRMGLEPLIASIGCPGEDEKPLEKEARRQGLRVEPFRMRPGPNIAGALRVMRFVRREKFDILHSHGYKGNILFGLMPKVLRQMPMVATLHGWTWTGGWDRMRVYEWLDRLSLRFIDQVVVVTEAMKAKVGIKNVSVVNNGIPLDFKNSTGSTNSHNAINATDPIDPAIAAFCRNGFTIGAIGRLSREKGFDLLLKAFAGLVREGNDFRLALLGEGGLRGVLEDKARALGIQDRVLMSGYVENGRDCMPLFGLFVLPSLTEGLPIVILEAMAAGVPIVASRVGGIPEVLGNGDAGLLVEPGSVAAVRDGILETTRNPEASRQRAAKAHQRVTEHYSSHAMAEKYRQIYQSLLPCAFQRRNMHGTQ